MSDLFDDFNKIFKKNFIPILVKYFKDPNNKISDNIDYIINDPRILLTDIFEILSKKNSKDINQNQYTDIENLNDIDQSLDDEYDELLKRLILIEENMIQIQKILKEKN
tara:strand:+ start:999 stop:1325 length:327 start_codon:yes stop_codon:yes gene_type:complete